MKLSKNNLRRALYALIDVMISGSSEFAEKAINALNDDELEIEGYIREGHLRDVTKMVDEWTKFDPNDPKTHPKEGTPVLLVTYNEHDKWGLQAGHASKKFVNCWATISRMFEFKVFWREVTFPPPPVETEDNDA